MRVTSSASASLWAPFQAAFFFKFSQSHDLRTVLTHLDSQPLADSAGRHSRYTFGPHSREKCALGPTSFCPRGRGAPQTSSSFSSPGQPEHLNDQSRNLGRWKKEMHRDLPPGLAWPGKQKALPQLLQKLFSCCKNSSNRNSPSTPGRWGCPLPFALFHFAL